MTNISSEQIRSAISDILKNGDLNSLTARKVRKQLEEKFEEDLKERKKEIDSVLMELIDAAQSAPENNEDDKKSTAVNKESEDEEEDEKSENENEVEEAEDMDEDKKNDSDSSDADKMDDEALARKLQDEETKTRSTRSAKKPPVKREKKESAPRKKRESGYSKKCLLSPELADIVGATEMARSEVVKKMWAVVKERNLFFPKNKQFALCDDQLKKVFGKKKVRIFGMMKYLKRHITDMKT